MKIKITNCKKNTFWYSDKIGEIFTSNRAINYPNSVDKGFEVYNDGKRSFIDVDDAEIVFEEF